MRLPSIHATPSEAEARMITRDRAIAILRAHGWETDSPTAWWPVAHPDDKLQGTWDLTSTFDLEMGIRSTYSLRDVKNWLGY
jgi:hypothetical protein